MCWRSPSLGDGSCRQDILPPPLLSCGCVSFLLPLPSPTVGMDPVERLLWGLGWALLTGEEQGRAVLCGACIWQEDLGEASGLGTYLYLPRGSSPTGESVE